MIDPLDIQLGRLLDEIDAAEEKDEWVNKRVAYLLDGEYNPRDCDNFIEAIGNMSPIHQLCLASKVYANHEEGLCKWLREVAHEYWVDKAEQRAEHEWQRR